MLVPSDAHAVFVCDCPTCGHRELRSARWLDPAPTAWTAICRRCGADVLVADLTVPAPRCA